MADDESAVPGDRIEQQLTGLLGQFGAMVTEVTQDPRWRYQLVEWEQVNDLAAEGWQLVTADIHCFKFVMARKTSAADEAVRILTEREAST